MSETVQNFAPVKYDDRFQKQLIAFFEKCLPQSGRAFDINGRHSYYKDIEDIPKYNDIERSDVFMRLKLK